MRPDEACWWLRQHIATGHVDTRTHEHSAREVVTYHTKHPEERDTLAESLAQVIADFDWNTAEQIETAAYLVVNLESGAALQRLIDSVGERDDPTGELATQVIAAIRSFPGNDAAHDRFLPALFRWLKTAPVAHLAYETLCDLSPEDAGAYFASLAHYYRDNSSILHKALTHLYFRNGDTNAGASAVRSVAEGSPMLVEVIKTHPFLPDTFKARVADSTHAEVAGPQDEESLTTIFNLLPLEKLRRCRQTQAVISEHGSLWSPIGIAA